VLALRDPDYGFDVQRMHCKQRSDQKAWTCSACAVRQEQKQQHHVHRMQQNAGEMVSSRIQAVELAIHRMRNPGQWMPVGIVEGGESPAECGPGDASPNGGI